MAAREAINQPADLLPAGKRKASAEDVNASANLKKAKPEPTVPAKKKTFQTGFVSGFKPTPSGPLVPAKATPVKQPVLPVKSKFRGHTPMSQSPDPSASAISISSSVSTFSQNSGQRYARETTEPIEDGAFPTGKVENNNSRVKVDPFLYGGLADENETLEREAAPSRMLTRTAKVLDGDVKWDAVVVARAQRQASNVRVLTDVPQETTSAAPDKPIKTALPAVVFQTSDLPDGTHARWTKIFIPAWRNYIGTIKNPWGIAGRVGDLQELWDLVFPSATHNHSISSGEHDPVYGVAMQRSYEWRGMFAKQALALVTAFWDTDPIYKSQDERAHFAECAIAKAKGLACLWGAIDNSDPYHIKYSKPFQSAWVLEVLAYHYAIPVGLPSEFGCTENAYGALVLASVGLERAFTMWRTGDLVYSENKVEDYFSETIWGVNTIEYAMSIEKLSEKAWTAIEKGARLCIKGKKAAAAVTQPVASTSARARMVESDPESE